VSHNETPPPLLYAHTPHSNTRANYTAHIFLLFGPHYTTRGLFFFGSDSLNTQLRETIMVRHKNDNEKRYHKGACIRCGKETTRRNSWAARLDSKGREALVLARDAEGRAITLKAGPRIHREDC